MPGEDDAAVGANGDTPMPTFDPERPVNAGDLQHLALEFYEFRGETRTRFEELKQQLATLLHLLSPDAESEEVTKGRLELRERALEVAGQLGAGLLDFGKTLIKSRVGLILSLAILAVTIPTGIIIHGSLSEGFTIEPAAENAALADELPQDAPVAVSPGDPAPDP